MHEENWIDKKFRLGLQHDEFPGLVARLESLPFEIEQTIKDVPPEKLMAQPEGQWSVLQHIGHLADLEELHLGRLEDFEAGTGTLRAADMSNSKTENANHNNASVESLLDSLRTVRARFLERLQRLSAEVQDRSIMHPRLQEPMRPVDLALFVTEHDAHHLIAIRRLISDTAQL